MIFHHQKSIRRKFLFTLGASFLLSACSIFSPPATYQPRKNHWQGRIALRTEEDKPQSFVASFNLLGNIESGVLNIISPLGTILSQLEWGTGKAVLKDGNKEYQEPSLNQLLARLLGVALPAKVLFAWLNGEPANLTGWRINLSRYKEGRIEALRESPLPRTQLRIILQ